MHDYTIVMLCLAIVIWVTLITNIIQLTKETKQLKEAGKTPLTSRNMTVIGWAAVSELIVVYIVSLIFVIVFPEPSILVLLLTFLSGYLLRNVGAYLAAWGLWSMFVRVDRKRMKKQIDQEKERAL